MSTTYAAVSLTVARYRVNDDGSVEEDPGDGTWRPKTDGHVPTSCWCGFGVVVADERFAGGNADMSRGRNWERIYDCRTCRGLNGPNPRAMATQ